jgi:hypothetical protein
LCFLSGGEPIIRWYKPGRNYNMSYSSDEDTDISDSEISEYENKYFEELKNGSQIVKTSDKKFTCPYCLGKKRKFYDKHTELLQHAIGVGHSNSFQIFLFLFFRFMSL